VIAPLLVAAIAGGTLATYLYDRESPLTARIVAGGPIGLAIFGLASFVFASFLGLDGAAIALGAAVALIPGALALAADRGAALRVDALVARDMLAGRLRYPDRWTAALTVLGGLAAWLVIRIFARAMFEGADGGILTADDHNLGDLPFHLGVISSFRYGANFPPEHPELAGVRLTYPFLVDFVTAALMRAGARVVDALFAVNVILALSLVALLFRWASLLTRDRLAAILTPLLILLSGGLGFRLLAKDVDPTHGGLVGLLPRMWHDYTIVATGELRWGNLVVTMLLPQRSILMGLPLVVTVWILWAQALAVPPADDDDRRRGRRLLAGAGMITGLLPLVHAHAFGVTVAAAVVIAVCSGRVRDWAGYFATAAVLAAPQIAWLAIGTGVQTQRFLDWQVGWDRGDRNALLFWLDNLGLFIPLLVIALLWGWRRGWLSRRMVLLTVPFLGCFVFPNLLKLSPWIWDNIKFLVFWHMASAPLVAMMLARLWRRGGGWRPAVALAVFLLTLSGALDVGRLVSRADDITVYDGPAVAFSHRIRAVTPVGAIVLHAPTYNSEVYLAGRRSVLGYAGHTWSQGLESGTRDQDIHAIYAGRADARDLLAAYHVGYVLLGPREREFESAMDESFLDGFPLIAESADHRLYALESPDARQP
jgi:hypothetical protein